MTGENIVGAVLMLCSVVVFYCGSVMFNRPAPEPKESQIIEVRHIPDGSRLWTNGRGELLGWESGRPEGLYFHNPANECYFGSAWHRQAQTARGEPEDFVIQVPKPAEHLIGSGEVFLSSPPATFRGEHRWKDDK